MDVLHKLKRVKNNWLIWPMKPIATSHLTRNQLDDTTLLPVQKSYGELSTSDIPERMNVVVRFDASEKASPSPSIFSGKRS